MVEFLNSDQAHALFADDATQSMDTKTVEADPEGHRAFLAHMRSYLNG
jgi:hypothetical protein